ncbi:MAG: polysaccharide biosynthesis/export family protein [Steroidobacteraceae bacterium]
MRNMIAGLLLLLGGVAVQAQTLPATSAATTGDYRLQAGDRLHVSVWKELEMQKEIIIAPDGRISFPLAGEINAAGRSISDVRKDIETRLKKYMPDPVVTVTVLQIGGNVAYVIGQVQKPGAIIMNPQITVLQALAVAGGGTPFAKLDNTIVIRAGKVMPFRYGQVSEGKNLQQNVTLESGDVIVVP